MTFRRRRSQLSAQPRLLAELKMLADNVHTLPPNCREFGRSLIAAAVRADRSDCSSLSDRQLLQVAKLIKKIRRKGARLGS